MGDCQLIPVLKANAYGLGAGVIGEYLAEKGIERVGLADINEAEELKHYFPEIHLLGDVFDSEIETIVHHRWLCPVTTLRRLKSWRKYSRKNTLNVQFNIDTGMGQAGIPIEVAKEQILEARKYSWVKIKGLYTHFTHADCEQDEYALHQIKSFRKLIKELEAEGLELPFKHIGNSNGINYLPESYKGFTHARSGINLYGVQESQTNKKKYLKEVLDLTTSVIRVGDLKSGDSLGYGRDFIAKKKTRIATIPMGYADGFPYQATKCGYVIINDHKCPVLGRVSMDYTTVDVTGVVGVKVGAPVILIGHSKSHQVTIEDWACWKNTIPYEIICSFGPRVGKHYLR